MASQKEEELQSKEALNACVSEICNSLQETMVKREALGGECSVPGTPTMRHRSAPAWSTPSAPPDGIWSQEWYCLLLQIIKLWISCMPGTFKLQLFSDTEFLLRKLPTSGPKMSWDKAHVAIRLMQGDYFWCGIPASVAPGHCTKKEGKYDLQATFNYWHIWAEEQVALSQYGKTTRRRSW